MARIRRLLAATPWSLIYLSALWSPANAADASAAEFYVRNLPGLPHDAPLVKMHAGHIEVTPEHHGNLFFWHFQNQHIANRQRTVIWINGGPGCSSEDGALLEIGPYRVSKDGNLSFNNGSWNEFANLLFVDNPVGTGFSFVDTDSYIHELDTMATQFIQFLEKFFALFLEYEKDDVYLAGESYAGQHIPYIAKAILDRNQKTASNAWNLKGLLVGNSWISPDDQYPAYVDFALQKGIIEKDTDIANELFDQQRKCQTRLKSDPGHVDYRECENILGTLLKLTSSGTGTDACINMYDVRLRDSYPSCGMSWPPDLKITTEYLRRTEVTEALHVSPKKNTGWQECSGAVGSAFQASKSKPSVTLLPELLDHVPILLFSGAEDLICSHMGTEQMLSKMEWSGGRGFEVIPGTWAPRRNWTFESEYAGFWQQARNLTYVLFEGASHMVAVDYPRRTRDMLDRFIGVDISSIGGKPTDSRIDGEPGPETTVGGASNHTHEAAQKAQKTIDNAKWAAYQRSGEIVLAIVAIAAAAWAYFVWRHRRRTAAYRALHGEDQSSIGLTAFPPRAGVGDLEAAAFDETHLDVRVKSPDLADGGRISLGDDSEEGVSDAELTPSEASGSKSEESQHRSS